MWLQVELSRDKLKPEHGYVTTVMQRVTLDAKRNSGASLDQIAEKELSLNGVQRPIDRSVLDNCEAVEWFRFGDFAGFVIEG